MNKKGCIWHDGIIHHTKFQDTIPVKEPWTSWVRLPFDTSLCFTSTVFSFESLALQIDSFLNQTQLQAYDYSLKQVALARRLDKPALSLRNIGCDVRAARRVRMT